VSDARRYGPSPGVAAEVIDGEAVIINLDTGVYHSMDRVGAQVWQSLAEGRTVDEVADALSGATGVSPDIASVDVQRVLESLLAEGLLIARQGAETQRAPLSFGSGIYAPPTLTSYRDMKDLLALDPPAPGLDSIAWNGSSSSKDK
jgi:hypothetical protein